MTMSPGCMWGTMSAIVRSTTAAGTINQMARGCASVAATSASDAAPVAFSPTNVLTTAGERSNTTHWCLALMCAGAAIAGTSSSSQSPPDNEFEADMCQRSHYG